MLGSVPGSVIMVDFVEVTLASSIAIAAKRTPVKSREEASADKKHELEKRLENVKGGLGTTSGKKLPKKGTLKP